MEDTLSNELKMEGGGGIRRIGYSSNQSDRCGGGGRGGGGGAAGCGSSTFFLLIQNEYNMEETKCFLSALTVTLLRHCSQLVPFFASQAMGEKKKMLVSLVETQKLLNWRDQPKNTTGRRLNEACSLLPQRLL